MAGIKLNIIHPFRTRNLLPQAVADYKAGKEKALNSLVGAVMKKTKGRADARKVREILLVKLG
ncbi:MAG TPA: hypothetical protein VJJ51_09970 [Candidatus Methanoperedens sp.]|nr:hypothetical protein [Candidatus Methanoperedens sp.]HLB71356.1 hypothetical protein [Candidatus Methanoperedens sp.]